MLQLTRRGLYCAAGGFYVDPMKPVDRAVVTHSHSDHARSGSGRYYTVDRNGGLLAHRIGERAPIESHGYGERFKIGGAWVSFHPAGHILGSSQVRVEVGSSVWVVSGDYKRDPDPTCEPFEVVPCETFITEATFGLPIYRWEPLERIAPRMVEWADANASQGFRSVICAYSLGKAQRVLAELGRVPAMRGRPVLVHETVAALNEVYERSGCALPTWRRLNETPADLAAAPIAIVAPGTGARALRALGPCRSAFASGWMIGLGSGGPRARHGYERGFVISDHADFGSLVRTARETGASRVLVTHGNHDVVARYLTEIGIRAEPLTRVDLPGETPG